MRSYVPIGRGRVSAVPRCVERECEKRTSGRMLKQQTLWWYKWGRGRTKDMFNQ